MSRTGIAVVQMASGPVVDANLQECERLVAGAAAAGAGLVVLPENFAFMGRAERDQLALREVPGEGPLQGFLQRVAREYGVWLVGGTIPLAAESADLVRAACLVFDSRGRQAARYDKMHLFDVELGEGRERYRESAVIEPGAGPVVLDTPFGRLGLAVCYDLRFPELFRVMLDQGMEILALPAAFTAVTGAAHWEVLVRARAIENLAWVAAADQGGYHVNGRETHGQSMIVDPWGRILAQLPRGNGQVTVLPDPEDQARIRASFPALDHRRLRCG